MATEKTDTSRPDGREDIDTESESSAHADATSACTADPAEKVADDLGDFA